MALVSIELGTSDGNQPVDILYCAEFHHLLENDTTFVFCEALVLPRSDGQYLALRLHWPGPPGAAHAADAIRATPEYRRSRLLSLIEGHEDDPRDRLATGVYLFQGSFKEPDLPINAHYPYPFSRIELSRQSETIRWWGTEASVPSMESEVVTSADRQEIRLWPKTKRLLARKRLQANAPVAIRFGAFMTWPHRRMQRVLKFLLSPYNVHFLTGHAREGPQELADHPGRLFLKFDPSPTAGGVSRIVKNLGMSLPPPNAAKEEPHTALWVLIPERWRVTDFPVSGTGFEDAGSAKWVLFSYGANWDLRVFKWNALSSRKYRVASFAELPLEDNQVFYVQRGTLRLQERLGTLISSLSVPVALKALAGVDSSGLLAAAYIGAILFQWVLDYGITKIRPSR